MLSKCTFTSTANEGVYQTLSTLTFKIGVQKEKADTGLK